MGSHMGSQPLTAISILNGIPNGRERAWKSVRAGWKKQISWEPQSCSIGLMSRSATKMLRLVDVIDPSTLSRCYWAQLSWDDWTNLVDVIRCFWTNISAWERTLCCTSGWPNNWALAGKFSFTPKGTEALQLLATSPLYSYVVIVGIVVCLTSATPTTRDTRDEAHTSLMIYHIMSHYA